MKTSGMLSETQQNLSFIVSHTQLTWIKRGILKFFKLASCEKSGSFPLLPSKKLKVYCIVFDARKNL